MSKVIKKKGLLINEMDDSVRRKLAGGQNPFATGLGRDVVNNLGSDLFQSIEQNLRDKGGDPRNPEQLLANALRQTIRIETPKRRTLEQLAIKMIREQYELPDEVKIIANIVNLGEVTVNPRLKTGTLKAKKPNKPQEDIQGHMNKRRIVNSMIHGAARKGQNLFHLANDDLGKINPQLVNLYSALNAANDYNYWHYSDERILASSEVAAGFVKVTYDAEGNPTIFAEALTFNFLLHELVKGVMEVISMWGLPEDQETRMYVQDNADSLESETWDIRIGPKIWEKFLALIEPNDFPYTHYLYEELIKLPPNEFHPLINEILRGSNQGKIKLKQMLDTIKEQLEGDDYNEALPNDEPTNPDDGGDDYDPNDIDGVDLTNLLN